MILPLLIRRSLRQHLVSSVLTAFSVALAGALLLTVWVTRDQARRAFAGATTGFDAVLGARGAKLQLVLNAVFHLEASPGNLKWEDFQEIRDHPAVDLAVPLAVGDNYRGYRIAGTTLDFFQRAEPAPGRPFALQAGGRWFDPLRREAVVGSFAARRLGLRVGDRFHPYHGLTFSEEHQHEEDYLVVGVLKPSNTPADRVIWIPLAGVQHMSGHDPAAATDLSAVLVKLKGGSPLAGFQLDQYYNRQGTRLTWAWPIGRVVAELFEKLAWLDRVLTALAALVALVAGAAITASMYNAMYARRRDVAILRALGARRRTVFMATWLEAVGIAGLGVVGAFPLYALSMSAVAVMVRASTGVVLEVAVWHPVMLYAPAALIALGGLAGLLPALRAYRTEVARHLVPVA
ncbi:MAG: ABC transporter permease [Verrucomicrobiae bacterium]|nr:ABC transporter permease [Verrucomicrobiae bacterium]